MVRMCTRGLYGTVVAPWQQALGDAVVTDTPVIRLCWSEDGVVINGSASQFTARLVVVAVPLGVLKHWCAEGTPEVLTPDLPACLAGPISRLGFGTENKVTLCFDADSTVALLLKDRDIMMTDDARFRRWVKGGDARTVFCFDTAAQDGSDVADEDRAVTAEKANVVLHRMLGISDADVKPPAAYHVTRWQDDMYARGAYSYMRAGSTIADFRALGEHHSQECPSLVFAGEHCLSKKNPSEGTMHSAIMSGVHAAELALDSDQLGGKWTRSKYTHDVIVVGGGLAGLSAASVLKDNGRSTLRVALIEAKSQCGGRVCSGTCGATGEKTLAKLQASTVNEQEEQGGSRKSKRRKRAAASESAAALPPTVDFGASFVMGEFVGALRQARPSQELERGDEVRGVNVKGAWLSSSAVKVDVKVNKRKIPAVEVNKAKKALETLVAKACSYGSRDLPIGAEDSFGAALDRAKTSDVVERVSYDAGILNTMLRYEFAYVCTPDELSLKGVKDTLSP